MSDSGPSAEKPQILSPEDLQRIPEDVRPKVELVVESYEAVFHGPLPPPAVLIQYGKAISGLPEKLVEWAEAETQHRRDMERRLFAEDRRGRLWGQASGVLISVLGLALASGLGVVSAVYSSAFAAGVATVVAIVSVGGPFAARLLARGWNQRDAKKDE